jgi:hypothetical protein
MFGNKDKRPTAAVRREAANAALRAEVERLEALPMAQLAAEVMVRAFKRGPVYNRDGSLAGGREMDDIIRNDFMPEDAWDGGLRGRLYHVLAEGLQVLEHQSLICVYAAGEDTGYAPTRRGQAALEAGAVEQALRGD